MDSNDKRIQSDSTEDFVPSVKVEKIDENSSHGSDQPLDNWKYTQKRKSSDSNLPDMSEENSGDDEKSPDCTIISVKRRRYSDSNSEQSNRETINSEEQNVESDTNVNVVSGKPTLIVTNTPGEWTAKQIITYLKEECGCHFSKNIDNFREGNSDSHFQLRMSFATKEQLNLALDKLKEQEVQGKLTVKVLENKEESEDDAESDVTVVIEDREVKFSNTRSDQDSTSDSNDFYIKEDYLQMLGIKPPVTNWVTVTNFRCDKSELKEVLELAGRVLICSVVTVSSKYANVMYSHPLEAVQAISMLNGQKFYGQNLKIIMNNSLEPKDLLPKGLTNVGPGLGKFGKRLPDIGDQFKEFVRGGSSTLDPNLFQPQLINRLGITIDPETRSYVRSIPTPNSTNSRNESPHSNNAESLSDKQIPQDIGTIGPQSPAQIPIIRSNIHNMPVTNLTSQTNSVFRPNGQDPRRPNLISPTIQGPRLSGPRFPACPPIPGVEGSPRIPPAHNEMMATSNPMIRHVSHPLSSPSPFSGPIRPMQGGPMSGPRGPAPPTVSALGPRGPTPGPVGPIPVPSPFVPGKISGPRVPGPSNILGPRPVTTHPTISTISSGPFGPSRSQSPVLNPRGPISTNGPIGQMRIGGPRQFIPPAHSGNSIQMLRGSNPVTLQISNAAVLAYISIVCKGLDVSGAARRAASTPLRNKMQASVLAFTASICLSATACRMTAFCYNW